MFLCIEYVFCYCDISGKVAGTARSAIPNVGALKVFGAHAFLGIILIYDIIYVFRVMGEFVSDDKELPKNLQTEKPRLKRSYAMFRECDPGVSGGYADGHVIKRMKENDHKTIQHLTEYKPATDNSDAKQRPHVMGPDESSVKKSINQHGMSLLCTVMIV